MPAILRKSLTACEALAALPPTPRKNSRPPRSRSSPSSATMRSIVAVSSRVRIWLASAIYSVVYDIIVSFKDFRLRMFLPARRHAQDVRQHGTLHHVSIVFSPSRAKKRYSSSEIQAASESPTLCTLQIRLRFRQALMRTDLIEALCHFVANHLALAHQCAIQIGQIGWLAGWDALDRRAAQQRRAVIDIGHLRRPSAFIVANELPIAEDHIAAIPAIAVVQHSHQPQRGASRERAQHRLVIDIEVGVTIHDP